jgi:hypothetical protein
VYAAQPFREMDGNAGAYGGLEARYLVRVVLRFLRYDNDANPGAVDPVTHTVAWNASFDSAGLRVDASLAPNRPACPYTIPAALAESARPGRLSANKKGRCT